MSLKLSKRLKLKREIVKLEKNYRIKFGMPKGMRLDEFFRKHGMTSMADAFEKDYQTIEAIL